MQPRTKIYSTDFDAFVSEVAADIWNKLVKNPSFYTLKPGDYPDVFEAVIGALGRYHRKKRLIHCH